MNGNCHFIFGATVSTMVAINLEKLSVVLPNITCSPETTSLLILGGILGGVMPDMDNPKSYIGRLSRPISTYIGKLGGLFGKKENIIVESFTTPLFIYAVLHFHIYISLI